MKKPEFVEKVFELWVTTAIPLTTANIQIYTKQSRRRIDKWLRQMTEDGVLGLDSDADGDLFYTVPGAKRPGGPVSFAAMRAKEKKQEAASAGLLADFGASPQKALAKRARKDLKADDGKKSILLSGGLSLFGPIGWFYAGSFKEAAIGTVVAGTATAILPKFILGLIGGPIALISVGAGMLYAWQYNRKGHRVRLLESDDDD